MPATKFTVNNNGSLKIEGDSKNKPFCDGSYNGNFEHEAVGI
jgi:CDGSH-type Zn-finger protein